VSNEIDGEVNSVNMYTTRDGYMDSVLLTFNIK